MDVNKADIKLVIGLGNPGKDYEKTYHNVGFLFVDSETKKSGSKWGKAKTFEYCKINGKTFTKTSVFMNESGKAVAEATKYFRLKPKQILVVHDDADIKLGKYKLQFDRSSAGHKGVESIIHTLKTQKFWRLRIGIGNTKMGLLAKLRGRTLRQGFGGELSRTAQSKIKAGDLVLKKISAEDLKKLNNLFEKTLLEIFH